MRTLSACLLCLIAMCGMASAQQPVAGAPQFVRTLHDPSDVTGKSLPPKLLQAAAQAGLDLGSLRGRPVLITYWSTWCAHCTAALADAEKLGASGSIASVAIDFDRDPAKAQEYLAKHNLTLRNIHDDGSVRATARTLLMPPYAMSIVLDGNGRVVFAQRSIFIEELLAAIGSLGPEYADLVRNAVSQRLGNGGELTPDEARQAAVSAVRFEPDYLSEQRKFVCRYDVKTLKDYGSGRSTSSVEHLEEVLATDGGHIRTQVVGSVQPGQADADAVLASDSFAIWKDPILNSVMEHSLISNVRVIEPGGNNTRQDRFAYFTFRGDPAFRPDNEVDEVAQSMVGEMALELNHNVLLMIDGNTDYAVVHDDKFLVERRMPLLIFHAVPYQETFLPSIWSETRFEPVSNDRTARQQWLNTLVRTFGERTGCKEFTVNSTVLPGFGVVPNTPR